MPPSSSASTVESGEGSAMAETAFDDFSAEALDIKGSGSGGLVGCSGDGGFGNNGFVSCLWMGKDRGALSSSSSSEAARNARIGPLPVVESAFCGKLCVAVGVLSGVCKAGALVAGVFSGKIGLNPLAFAN